MRQIPCGGLPVANIHLENVTMSHDFTPSHHIGMTAQGYYLGGAKNRKTIKKKQIAQHLNNWLVYLENLMDHGDVKAEKMLRDFYETKACSRFL